MQRAPGCLFDIVAIDSIQCLLQHSGVGVVSASSLGVHVAITLLFPHPFHLPLARHMSMEPLLTGEKLHILNLSSFGESSRRWW